MFSKNKVSLTEREKDTFIKEMGDDSYFSVDEFIKAAKLEKSLFFSEDLRRLNQGDR